MAACDKAEAVGCLCATCYKRDEDKVNLCCVTKEDFMCREAERIGGKPWQQDGFRCKLYQKEEEYAVQ